MAAAGRFFFIGLAGLVPFCLNLDVVQSRKDIEELANAPYKYEIDMNGDGRKDFRYSDGTVLIKTSSGRYERTIPAWHNNQPGFISRKGRFYNFKGEMFDLHAPQRKDSTDSDDERRDPEVMLTFTESRRNHAA